MSWTITGTEKVTQDPYLYTSTVLLLHGDGTNGSTTVLDSSKVAGSPKTVTAFGNAQISTAQSKFGGASMAFDGSGDYLLISNNSQFAIGINDFTMEAWVYTATTSGFGAVLGYANGSAQNSNYAYQLLRNGSGLALSIFSGNTQYASASVALSINTWAHVAFVRSGNTLTSFINGMAGSPTNVAGVTANTPSNAVLHIGQVQGYYPWNGYIDDLRITKAARYTANFTPPTAAFPDS